MARAAEGRRARGSSSFPGRRPPAAFQQEVREHAHAGPVSGSLHSAGDVLSVSDEAVFSAAVPSGAVPKRRLKPRSR